MSGNPPLFYLFLATDLKDEAEDIYASMIQQPKYERLHFTHSQFPGRKTRSTTPTPQTA